MIYLDFNATTPVAAPVLEAMLPWFHSTFANASSTHASGRRAMTAVEASRDMVAELLGCSSREIVFTSGATEAINLALKGLGSVAEPRRNRILVSATEHKAVLEAAVAMKSSGITLDLVPVDHCGVVDLAALEELLAPDVLMVTVMAANNETGTLNPIRDVVELAKQSGALVHTDATQWVGKLPMSVGEWGIDLLSLSGHKMYAPQGVGALYVRHGVSLNAMQHGGGHERGLRSGTYNVPGIVGLGQAAELSRRDMNPRVAHQELLRDRLYEGIRSRLVCVNINGHPFDRLPNTVNLSFEGIQADAAVSRLHDLAVSSGSACTSAIPTSSHVLTAMGIAPEIADASLRFSVGWTTTIEEIDLASEQVATTVSEMRDLMGWESTSSVAGGIRQ